MTLPRVYCASPWRRAKMWTTLDFPGIRVVSTWHNNGTLVEAEEDNDPAACRAAWDRDFRQIRSADHLLVYAEHKDRPNGTLVEIGYALSHEMPIHLVGNFEWGTWRYEPLIHVHKTLREATSFIATGKYPTDDPTKN